MNAHRGKKTYKKVLELLLTGGADKKQKRLYPFRML